MNLCKVSIAALAGFLIVFQPLVGVVGARTAAEPQEGQILVKPQGQPGSVPFNPRTTGAVPPIKLDQAAAFARLGGAYRPQLTQKTPDSRMITERSQAVPRRDKQFWAERGRQAAASISPADIGTGDGDIFEIEPNDTVAQDVSLPVNVEGVINPLNDVDFFAFQAFARERIDLEAFASQIPGSELIADIALFDSAGNLLVEGTGDGINDPFVTFDVPSDQVLVAGITDVQGLGGPDFEYVLSIEAGVDVQEVEPNDRIAQALPTLPVNVFGAVGTSGDVDFYSFFGKAGQTLIAQVDAAFFGSTLPAEINLTDPTTGVQYFIAQFDGANDPRFNIVLPTTGTFVIGIDSEDGVSTGFYRMNLSLVDGAGAPTVTSATIVAKKLIQVTGTGFVQGTSVEVNGAILKTFTTSDPNTLQAKVKGKVGQTVTVENPPDGRRSNPILIN